MYRSCIATTNICVFNGHLMEDTNMMNFLEKSYL
ncbi:hypothetical protein EGR_04329 [Echinococcus granulosus]|uniref:Uncharacterized protein n=1 Tax=Echinococcus granulosus TaxID=6210 RepID=W6UH31_ECHGR|nr:hypothetical protein EGR_04329 [Echinococcus granulosus]EUB60890.1 hypothetical protein EGR_04329 [Echinococcus granulosus]